MKITAARVGLPPGGKASDRDDSGQAAHVAKFACWAPVYVDLELADTGHRPGRTRHRGPGPGRDHDHARRPAEPRGGRQRSDRAADLGTIGYVRPAGVGEVTITIRAANGGKPLAEPFRVRSLRPRDPLTYVVLSLGGPFSGFDLPKPTGGVQDASAGAPRRAGRTDDDHRRRATPRPVVRLRRGRYSRAADRTGH